MPRDYESNEPLVFEDGEREPVEIWLEDRRSLGQMMDDAGIVRDQQAVDARAANKLEKVDITSPTRYRAAVSTVR